MPQSKRRAQQLLEQYPFLEWIHEGENMRPAHIPEVNIQICVERGDANLLFRRANDVDGIGRTVHDPEHPDLIGTRHEYFRPVNREGKLGEIHDWQEWKKQYVRDLFNSGCYDWTDRQASLIDPLLTSGEDPFKVIDFIVWVTREDWYSKDADLSRLVNRARPVRRDVQITLHREPKRGWRNLYLTADPLVNVWLSGWRLIKGPVLTDSFMDVVVDKLHRLAMEFQMSVWETGLGKAINNSRTTGMSGQLGTVSIMSLISAGRLRIQLERGDTLLVFDGFDEDPPRLGFGSIEGTAAQAEKLVRDAIKFWKDADSETRRTVHQNNSNVGLG